MQEEIIYSDRYPKNRYFIIVRKNFFGEYLSCFIYNKGKITFAIKDRCEHNIFRSEILSIFYIQKEDCFVVCDEAKRYTVQFSFGKKSSVTFVCEGCSWFQLYLSDRACRQIYSALMSDCDAVKVTSVKVV